MVKCTICYDAMSVLEDAISAFVLLISSRTEERESLCLCLEDAMFEMLEERKTELEDSTFDKREW